MLEEELPEVRQLRQADLPGRDALRIDRGMHPTQERAGRRRFPEAELLAPRSHALRLARRVDAEGRRPLEGGAVGAPRGDVLGRRAAAPGEREADQERSACVMARRASAVARAT